MTVTKIDVEGGSQDKKTVSSEQSRTQDAFLKLDEGQMSAELCSMIKSQNVSGLSDKLGLLKEEDESKLKRVISIIDQSGEFHSVPDYYDRHTHYEIMELLMQYDSNQTKNQATPDYWKPGDREGFLKLSNEQMFADLFSSIKDEDVTGLKEKLALLKQEDEVRLKKILSTRDRDQDLAYTLLNLAARHSQCEIMELLIDYGADPKISAAGFVKPGHVFAEYGKRPKGDKKDLPFFNIFDHIPFDQYLTSSGNTLLHVAAKRGNLFTINLILEMKSMTPKLSAVNHEKKDALHLAAVHNKPEVVRLFIQRRDWLQRQDNQGNTCLHLACINNSTESIDAILDETSDIYPAEVVEDFIAMENDDKETAMLIALKNNNFRAANRLAQDFGSKSIQSIDENFAIHNAALTGNIPMVKILLKFGAKTSVLNQSKMSPLMLAAENNMVEVAKLLLDENVNVDQKCADGKTALIVAAENGCTEMVKLLTDYNANVDLTDEKERTALHYGSTHDNPELLKILIDSDIDKSTLEDGDSQRRTPLHLAAEAGRLEAVKYLVSQGSSALKRDKDDYNSLHVAAMAGNADVIEFLVLHNRNLVHSEGFIFMKPLTLAAYEKKFEAVKVLLKYGATDIQEAFEYSIMQSDKDSADLLLKHGALVNGKNNEYTLSTSPLMYAANVGNTEMISFLLEIGADIKLVDDTGANALTELINFGPNKMEILEVFFKKVALKTGLEASIDVTHRNTKIKVPETPFRLMIRLCPEAAWRVMNIMYDFYAREGPSYIYFRFIDDTFQFTVDHADEKIIYRYTKEVQDKPYHSDRTVLMENHPLMLMVRHDQKHLLKHPVCTNLLKEKWRKFGRYLYYSMLSVYLLYLAMLTTFSMVATNPSLTVNGTCPSIDERCLIKGSLQSLTQWLVVVIASLSIILRVVNLVRVRRYYLTWSNLLDVTVHLLGLVFVIDFTNESSVTGLRMKWQWQLGAVTITMAWLNLLSLTRNLPLFGIYVIMFIDILRTFSKFGLVFLVFIVAFGTGFHMLLQLQTPFTTIGKSLLKTSVMMIGEFEFESIFYSEADPDNLAYPGITFAFFIGFLIIMSIIIVNLLVGLAVDDIKAVQDQAELKRLAMTVEQVLDVERMLPKFLFKKSTIKDVRFKEGSQERQELGDFQKEVTKKSFENEKSNKLEDRVNDIAEEISEIRNILKAMKSDAAATKINSESQMSTLPASPKLRPNPEDEAQQILSFLNPTEK